MNRNGTTNVTAQGTLGNWWSAGSNSSTHARALAYNGNYTYLEDNAYKTHGLTVRCDQGSTRANDILHQFPFSLPYSGYVDRTDGMVYNQGTVGSFWSAGSDSATNARLLDIGGNYTYLEPSYYKTNGFSVRRNQGSTRANDILHKFPFSLPYSGYVYRESGATVNQSTDGHWWSAGSDSSTNARVLAISSNYTGPEDSGLKTSGFSVRCVVKVSDQGSTRVNNILHKFPFSLPYSGRVSRDSGATVLQGTYGYWWSAGSDSSTNARRLDIYGSYTHPEYSYYKTNGFSVRCVVFLPSVVEAGSIY